MNAEEFVRRVRKSIIEENLSTYKDLFQSTDPKDATDPHWNRALQLYDDLSDEDRAALFAIVRQSMVDTISNIFGILDGTSGLDGELAAFSLIDDSTAERLNGELQDRFLEQEE